MFQTKKMNKETAVAAFPTLCLGLLILVAIYEAIHTAVLGHITPVLTILGIEISVLLIAGIAWKGHQPWWMVIPCAGCIVASGYMNHVVAGFYYAGLLVTAAICGIWALAGCFFLYRRLDRIAAFPKLPAILLLAMLVILGCVWGINVWSDKHQEGSAEHTVWAVPACWDTEDDEAKGIIEEIFYTTYAYATDQREITKSALVYLPAGYDESRQYNILYLMHGTGDDQYYWLQKFSYNKVMLDRLIDAGEIEPLIVVTPTFYCESDCMEDVQGPEKLTYSFKDELRNDLMPAAESKYSTYAETADDAGFKASRHHRAFAGLSRGAVTTYRSVMCGALDYFASFGTFSASRIPAEYYQAHAQSDEFADYSIDYLYVATGNFDHGLPQQLKDYHAMLAIDSRLELDENTSLDVFPMRYHSMGNWHLALYNFLQKLFK